MSTKPSIDASASEKRRVCESTEHIHLTPARPRPPWQQCLSVLMWRLQKQKDINVNESWGQKRSCQISAELHLSKYSLIWIIWSWDKQWRTGGVIVGGRLLLLHIAMAQQLGHAHRDNFLIKGPEDKWRSHQALIQHWHQRDDTDRKCSHTLLYLLVRVRPSIPSEMPSGETWGWENTSSVSPSENQNDSNGKRSDWSCHGVKPTMRWKSWRKSKEQVGKRLT